jgi:anti-sigma regulatory factor (Ser/Thr protein kinase)
MLPNPARYLVRLTMTSGGSILGVLRSRIEASLRGAGDDFVADVQLVATELVTNAFLHGEPPVRFDLLAAADGQPLRIEVSDGGQALPTVRRPDSVTPNGRGLLLVDGSSSRWGVTTHRPGKTVWAEF